MPNTKTTHTPGPWRWETREFGYAIHPGGPGTIADNIPDKANARLIAAAPDLLAIAQEIANDPKCDLVTSERRIRLYSAITKAGADL